MNSNTPLVSLGLPVYNGENFLAQAIDSILAQTFVDFELVITDNASTDGTKAICEHYAAKDARIRYHRNPQNLGAGPNFNLAFELTRGKYFKWVAHDDLIAPEFLEKCVAIMELDPAVVLCFSHVAVVDEQECAVDYYDVALDTSNPKPERRYRSLMLDWHMCFDIFGLIRSDALQQTPLMGNYGHGDGVLLARLSLFGRFHKIDEYLFYSRRHEQQSMRQFGHSVDVGGNDYHAYAAWFDTAKKTKLTMPQWRILGEYCLAIWQTPTNFVAKIYCHFYAMWWIVKNRYHLVGDLIFVYKYLSSQTAKRSKSGITRLFNAKLRLLLKTFCGSLIVLSSDGTLAIF